MLRTLASKQMLWLLMLILLAFVRPSSASPVAIQEQWRSLVPIEMSRLPDNVLKWYITEVDFLSRDVDPVKIVSPHDNEQAAYYKPESKNVFDLMGLWVPQEELKIYDNGGSKQLTKRFYRTRNGRSEVLFLIHPESLSLYQKLLDEPYEKEYFKAVGTASSRSLLVWKPGLEKDPFIAKLSLDKKIASVVRNLKGAEAAKSVGISTTLEGSKNLPKNFLYMKESFSAIPRGFETGGMILREIPEEMKNGSSHFVPLFALYGNERPGFLLWLLRNSNEPVDKVLSEAVLAPFANLWAQLVLEQGILMEPHAQNVLLELKNNRPTGRFLFRDFGGFTIDFEFRKSQGLFVPDFLPLFSKSLSSEYHLDEFKEVIRMSLAVFFDGGFLFNVDHSLKRWQKNNWISGAEKFDVYRTFQIELVKALKARTQKEFQSGPYYEGIEQFILSQRAPICEKLFLRN